MRMPGAALPGPAESEVDPGVSQVSVARGIGDPEFLYGRFFSNAFQDRIDLAGRHTCLFGEGNKLCGQESFADHMSGNRVLALGSS